MLEIVLDAAGFVSCHRSRRTPLQSTERKTPSVDHENCIHEPINSMLRVSINFPTVVDLTPF